MPIRNDGAKEHCERGVELFKSGSSDEALKEFDLALETNPEIPEAYYYRGLIFEAKGIIKEALNSVVYARMYDRKE